MARNLLENKFSPLHPTSWVLTSVLQENDLHFMKKTYFLPLFLCLAFSAFSQKKRPEFGFTVKAGNFTLPSENTFSDFSSSYNQGTVSNNAGSSYAIGIWNSWSLGTYLRISASLMYRSASLNIRQRNNYTSLDLVHLESIQEQKTNLNSLLMPVHLHIAFKKDGKFSLVIGGGPNQIFSSQMSSKFSTQIDDLPQTTNTYSNNQSDWTAFGTTLNFNAGLFYKLDSKTSVGLDYSLEKPGELIFGSRLANINPLIDCICFYGDLNIQRNMNSFSVSLRHNILD
jgi:hypothetical protein